MNIVDCHIHCSESGKDALTSYARENGLKYNLGELVSLMEENGVNCGLLLSPPQKNGKPIPNAEILKLCRRSKDKLFPIVTVEPTGNEVEECLKFARQNKDSVKGFKILLGYFPVYATHKVYARIYDYAERENLPVMFHTGDTASRTASLEHARPLSLDPLANKREDLKIVVCHFGNPWFHEAAELLYKHPNVYADISGLFVTGAKYSQHYLKYLSRTVSEAIYFVGSADKILFGTDYPIERYSDAIMFAKSLKLDNLDTQKILSQNARKVFDF
jgi:predicted TIM-barrel fold metal-dependent hydrolase